MRRATGSSSATAAGAAAAADWDRVATGAAAAAAGAAAVAPVRLVRVLRGAAGAAVTRARSASKNCLRGWGLGWDGLVLVSRCRCWWEGVGTGSLALAGGVHPFDQASRPPVQPTPSQTRARTHKQAKQAS